MSGSAGRLKTGRPASTRKRPNQENSTQAAHAPRLLASEAGQGPTQDHPAKYGGWQTPGASARGRFGHGQNAFGHGRNLAYQEQASPAHHQTQRDGAVVPPAAPCKALDPIGPASVENGTRIKTRETHRRERHKKPMSEPLQLGGKPPPPPGTPPRLSAPARLTPSGQARGESPGSRGPVLYAPIRPKSPPTRGESLGQLSRAIQPMDRRVQGGKRQIA